MLLRIEVAEDAIIKNQKTNFVSYFYAPYHYDIHEADLRVFFTKEETSL